ncbi:MAG: hypothetical protein C4576_16025 [Desulfobacteraceae bacterium]|nr:MAG: hypothetical protein C4576_16025 [Desulfobacteraceae bacterium]
MDKPESIIEAVFDNSTTEAKTIMAETLGKERIPSPTHYRNLKTGELYSYIAGGIAWPGKVSKGHEDPLPGFAVVVSIEKTDRPEPAFMVMEDVEESNVEALMRECLRLRYKYGFKPDGEVMNGWFGDPEPYRSVVSGINKALEKNKEGIFFIRGMPDLHNSEDFNFFARRVLSVLKTDESGKKRLSIGNNDRLRNRIQDPIHGAVAIKALGYVIHALLYLRPWEIPIDGESSSYIKF